MGYSAKAIANYFLDNYGRMNLLPKISPLKLQKLVYLSHGWSLGILGKDLVDDEHAEAWQYGPVFPSLHHEFKDFGNKSINRNATDLRFSPDSHDFRFEIVTPTVGDDKTIHNLLDKIWKVYGKYTPHQLSNIASKEDSPWHQANKKSNGIRNFHIDNDIIKKYYVDLANG